MINYLLTLRCPLIPSPSLIPSVDGLAIYVIMIFPALPFLTPRIEELVYILYFLIDYPNALKIEKDLHAFLYLQSTAVSTSLHWSFPGFPTLVLQAPRTVPAAPRSGARRAASGPAPICHRPRINRTPPPLPCSSHHPTLASFSHCPALPSLPLTLPSLSAPPSAHL